MFFKLCFCVKISYDLLPFKKIRDQECILPHFSQINLVVLNKKLTLLLSLLLVMVAILT